MMSKRLAIVGLGNPLRGDDGVGCRVIEELSRWELPPGVELLDGGAIGLGLLDLIEGWELVILVDAAEMGRRPGEFLRFTPDDVLVAAKPDSCSFHQAGLSETLTLAGVLGLDLPEMVIFGIQPQKVGWGENLSPVVEAALPVLAEAVLNEISTYPKIALAPVPGGEERPETGL